MMSRHLTFLAVAVAVVSVPYALLVWLAGAMMAAPSLLMSDIWLPTLALGASGVPASLVLFFRHRLQPTVGQRRVALLVVFVTVGVEALLLATVSDLSAR